MTQFGNDLAIRTFSQHDKIIGNGVAAFIACERRKRKFIKSTEYTPPTSRDISAYVLTTFTEAQNHIKMEILFRHLMDSQLKYITGGIFKTLSQTKKNKGKKKRGSLGKYKGGNKDTKNHSNKLKHIIVTMLLFSLKSLTLASQSQLPPGDSAAFKHQKLDSTNEQQMHNFASQFGKLEIEQNTTTVLKSENISKLFLADFLETSNAGVFRSFFSSMTTDDFHADIMKRTVSLFNDKMNDVHVTMGKICERFIETTTIDSPTELGRIFNAEMNRRDYALRTELAELKTNTIADIRENVTVGTGVPEVTFAESMVEYIPSAKSVFGFFSPKTSTSPDGTALMAIGATAETKENVIRARISDELPAVLQDFETNFKNTIKNTMVNKEDQHKYLLDRKIFFNNLCDVGIRRTKLEYNKTEESFYFTDFPYHRSLIEVMIQNVLVYSKENVFETSSEDDIGKSGNKHASNAKQIEMAEFLSDVFVKWDTAFIKAITKGHQGKRSVGEFITSIEREIQNIHSFMNDGVDGEPTQVRLARNNMNKAILEKNIDNVDTAADNIRNNMTDEQRAKYMNRMDKATDYYYGISTLWLTKGWKNTKTGLKNEIWDIVSFIQFIALTTGGSLLLLCMGYYYCRKLTPVFMPSDPPAIKAVPVKKERKKTEKKVPPPEKIGTRRSTRKKTPEEDPPTPPVENIIEDGPQS